MKGPAVVRPSFQRHLKNDDYSGRARFLTKILQPNWFLED